MEKIYLKFLQLIILSLACLLIACSLPANAGANTLVSTAEQAPVITIPATPLIQEEFQQETTTTESKQIFMPTIVRAESFRQAFGVSLHPYNEQGGMTAMKNANAVWTRIEIDWHTVQPSPAEPNWNDPVFLEREAQIKAAAQQGYRIVILLNHTPAWAVKQGFDCGVVREDAFDDFIVFAKEIVKRFSAYPYNVHYYELYNEPDAPSFMGCWGDVNDPIYFGGWYYGKFLQAVYSEIKTANASANLMVGGLLLGCNPNLQLTHTGERFDCPSGRFFEGILASGAKNSFDGVAFHAYDYFSKDSKGEEYYENLEWDSKWNTTGPVTLVKSRFLRDLMKSYGAEGKFLMNTEIAILCGSGDTGTCKNALRQSPVKTYYVVYSFISSIVDGYPAAIWYSALGDDRGNELLKPDLTPTPAYYAFQFMATKLKTARFSHFLSPGTNVTGYEFENGAGKRIWVLWATDRLSHSVNLPTQPSSVHQIGLDGKGASLSPSQSLNVTIAPLFVEFP